MRSLLCILLLQLGLGACAQSFLWDGTFQPYFNIRNQPSVYVADLYELNSGKIIISGDFDFTPTIPTVNYNGLTATYRSGTRIINFGSGGFSGAIIPLNDSIFTNVTTSGWQQVDTNGNRVNLNWFFNSFKTARCQNGIPLFFKDGSSLRSNSTDNSGLPCTIVNAPDTFPGRYIIKLTPQGLWDSTFNQGDANYQPDGYAQYDSNRIMVYGQPDRFTHYNGVQVDGLCRVFLDGTLDTTFHSPLDGSRIAANIPRILRIEPNGKFFVGLKFYLKNHLNSVSLARLNPDGSLDTTFNNFGSPSSLNPQLGGGVNTIEKTPDGGYLVGGYFQNYQGQAKNAIAKIDSNGNVEPQYFTFGGPSTPSSGNNLEVIKIIKSKFGGYYVGGTFTQWDGVACQPIVRLTDLLVGVEEAPFGSAQGASVSVYPNPSNGIFTVKSEAVPAAGRLGIVSVEVFDLMGTLVQFKLYPEFFSGRFGTNSASPNSLSVREKSIEGHNLARNEVRINLSSLPSGVYLLKLTMQNGEVITKKLIKQ